VALPQFKAPKVATVSLMQRTEIPPARSMVEIEALLASKFKEREYVLLTVLVQ
jgi:hypothetical protein